MKSADADRALLRCRYTREGSNAQKEWIFANLVHTLGDSLLVVKLGPDKAPPLAISGVGKAVTMKRKGGSVPAASIIGMQNIVSDALSQVGQSHPLVLAQHRAFSHRYRHRSTGSYAMAPRPGRGTNCQDPCASTASSLSSQLPRVALRAAAGAGGGGSG